MSPGKPNTRTQLSNLITLDYAPYPYQEDFHFTDRRFSLIVGGRRVGKSKMACMELIKHCLETPNAIAWWVAPTFSMAREIGWAEFKEYEDALEPALATVHETLLRVRFTNGATLYFKSADNERGLRGRGLTYLVMDEAAFIEPQIWSRALFPALTDKKGKALLISTPNGRNWFYETYQTAKKSRKWLVDTWPTSMNPLITETELEMSKLMVSDQDFRQEFLAEFVTKAGMVYDDFSDENIIEEGIPFERKGDYEVYLGVDFGFANPTAICFMAVAGDTVIQFDEMYISRASMEVIEHGIVETLAKHGLQPDNIDAIYTDPAGNAEELSSGISPVDYLRQGRYEFTVRNKGTSIAPGLALTRSFIKNAQGERSYYITKNCQETIRSLFGYTYARTTTTETIKEEPLKDGIHDHMADAIRYFFVNQYQQDKWIAKRPDTWVYGMEREATTMNMKRCPICRRQFPSSSPRGRAPYKCKDCTS